MRTRYKTAILFWVGLILGSGPSCYGKMLEQKAISKIGLSLAKLKESLNITHFTIAEALVDERDRQTPTTTWTQISLSYRVNNKIEVYLNPRFELDFENSENNGFLDPSFGIGGNLIDNEKWLVAWNLNTLLPLESEENERLLSFGGPQTIEYTLSENITLGVWPWFRAYLQEIDDKENIAFEAVISPYVSYRFTDDYALFLWNDNFIEGRRAGFSGIESSENSTLVSGVSVAINRELEILPHIGVDLQNPSLKTARVSAWLSGRLF